jgi:hypothetical protein
LTIITRNQHSINKNLTQNAPCALDVLPYELVEYILLFLPHSNLIDFAIAFRKYQQNILDPIFWRSLSFENICCLNIEDIHFVLLHVGKQLKELNFSTNFKIKSDDFLQIISCNSKIERLKCPTLIQMKTDFMIPRVSKKNVPLMN